VGDMLMITPAVRALMDAHPEAEFHMLTGVDGQRVFKGFSAQLTTFLLHERKSLFSKLELKKLLRQVRVMGYDSAYCFELNPTFTEFYQAAEDGGHCVDISHPELHFSRRCLNLVQSIDGSLSKAYWLNLPVTDDARARAEAILAEVGVDRSTFVIGLHPTYSGLKKVAWRRKMDSGRRWPTESFAALAKLFSAYAGRHGIKMRIIMDLMPEEMSVGEEIVKLSGGEVTMLTPPLDFQRYKATLARMNLFVTTDTGPMHIGGAVGANLVALFGGTDPDDSGAYVPGERYQVVQSASEKISDITAQQVFDASRRFLPGQ